ncbi:MAG: lipoyl(octanoyl) transferase LipB [Phycisphaerales bacterium]|nr:lipoyl(octanoyl) transferase LipB [Phycisphaerales bacterium]
MPAENPNTLHSAVKIVDLGRISYAGAYARQRAIQERVIDRRGERDVPVGTILLLEHDPPVITVSRRPGAREHLLAPPEMLARRGVELIETDRGGDITYHGPDQVVAYAILDLNRLSLNLRSYMHWLEQIVIDAVATFSIQAERDPDATGVWVEQAHTRAKLCAMGVRVSRWVSMHGLALNVDPEMSHFQMIVPCGLAGRSVTSLRELLGEQCPTTGDVKLMLADAFVAAVRLRIT